MWRQLARRICATRYFAHIGLREATPCLGELFLNANRLPRSTGEYERRERKFSTFDFAFRKGLARWAPVNEDHRDLHVARGVVAQMSIA